MQYFTADNGERILIQSSVPVEYREEYAEELSPSNEKEYDYWGMQHALRVTPRDTFQQVKTYLLELGYPNGAVDKFMYISRKEYARVAKRESYADWVCSPKAAYTPTFF